VLNNENEVKEPEVSIHKIIEPVLELVIEKTIVEEPVPVVETKKAEEEVETNEKTEELTPSQYLTTLVYTSAADISKTPRSSTK
jgi:hypothetical protein